MSVLDRASLEESPLADLHAIASELGLDGYRRLRKADLIDALLERQGGDEEPKAPAKPARSRARKAPARAAEPEAEAEPEPEPESDAGPVEADEEEEEAPKRRRGRRGGRGGNGARAAAEEPATPAAAAEPAAEEEGDREPVVEGIVELLPNGSGFMRVSPPDPSDDDVYISAAQVKRCELVAGDRIAGPRRAPRRSERFPSLVRIDTINGAPASEVAQGQRFDELPAAFPTERLKLGSEDATVKAIEWLTPIGKGSRVTIVGPARSGKTEALARLAEALTGQDELSLQVVLAGVRPEELGEWRAKHEPVAVAPLGASPEVQGAAVEQAIDHARRLVARGADVVVLIDSLEHVPPAAARRALASARKIVDGGSLTVIATAAHPLGGETTVIALDVKLTSTGRFPALDLVASGTMRPELLVGEAGAEAIAGARAEALDA